MNYEKILKKICYHRQDALSFLVKIQQVAYENIVISKVYLVPFAKIQQKPYENIIITKIDLRTFFSKI